MHLSLGLNKSLNSLTTECYGIWYRGLDMLSFESGDASKFHSMLWNSTPCILHPFLLQEKHMNWKNLTKSTNISFLKWSKMF